MVFITYTRMPAVRYSQKHTISEGRIRVFHIGFQSNRRFTFFILPIEHHFPEFQIIFNAMTPMHTCNAFTPIFPQFFCWAKANICEAFPYHLLCILIEQLHPIRLVFDFVVLYTKPIKPLFD